MYLDRRRILKGLGSLIGWSRGLESRSLPPLSENNLVSGTEGAVLSPGNGIEASRAKAESHPPGQNTPKFEDYATIEARIAGEPVYCLDYMMYIYGVGPDLMSGVVMQEGNSNPLIKIKPKKSWEIKWNLLG